MVCAAIRGDWLGYVGVLGYLDGLGRRGAYLGVCVTGERKEMMVHIGFGHKRSLLSPSIFF